jgi:hypothetical protein
MNEPRSMSVLAGIAACLALPARANSEATRKRAGATRPPPADVSAERLEKEEGRCATWS